jgi:HSP20 family protein
MKLPLKPCQSSRNALTFKGKMIKSSNTPDKFSGGGMAFQPKEDTAWIALFRQHMEEMCSDIFSWREQRGGWHEFSPLMDIYESAGSYVIEMDLPGFSESDFMVTVIGSALRIEGVKRHETAGMALNYICLERHFGRFSRTIEIPPAFDPDRMQLRFGTGVLVLSIPPR